jgi:Icc-related predicted phosphoesterase
MKKGVFVICLGLLFAIMIYFNSAVATEIAPSLRFIIIGDRTGGNVPDIYEEIVAEVERLKPDFVMTVGDMIEGYTADTVRLNNQWDEYKSIISKLSMPIYYTPGNHDITTDAALGTYKKHIGEPYYSFDINNIHFVIIDNSRWNKSDELPKEQIDWLINDLKNNQNAKFTFVFHHKPFWFESTAAGKSDTLHSIFKTYGISAIFNGHYHEYFSGKYDGITYTCLGSSGGSCDPGPTGLHYHFTLVTVDDKQFSIAPIKIGSVLPWDEISANEMKYVYDIKSKGFDFENPLELDQKLDLIDKTFNVKLHNLNKDIKLEDTLRWETFGGWKVTPEILPISLNSGDSTEAKFAIEKLGALYPKPQISINYPYKSGKKTKISKEIITSRKAFCSLAKKSPIIDGIINEPMWSSPDFILFSPEGENIITDSVFFYFTHDNNNLYLAAYCKEQKVDSIMAVQTERDAPIYGEDCVGFFIQPDIDTDIVYQIYFNPLGVSFDQKITRAESGGMSGDPKWNGNYEVKTTRGKDFWSVEAQIPFSELSTKIESGRSWGLNFRRKQFRLASSANWQVPIDYEPSSFGRLIFQ